MQKEESIIVTSRAQKVICTLLALAILLSGCASTTLFKTSPTSADIYINEQKAGITPYSYTDKKAAGTSTSIAFKKDGYKDLYINLKRNEQLDIGALIAGIYLLFPFVWIKKYNPVHYYEMEKVESDKHLISGLDSGKYRTNDLDKKESLEQPVKMVDTTQYRETNLEKRERIEQPESKADTSFYLSGDDGRIILSVDSITKAELFPEKLKQKDIYGKVKEYRLPKTGHDYVFTHITIIEKKDLRIEPSELRLTKTQLIDDKSKTYFSVMENLNITFTGKQFGYILFEIPKGISPVRLSYLYLYRDEPPESQEIKTGQIDIDLIKQGEPFNETKSSSEESTGTVKDINGNVYNTVIIGTQVWMKENLKTTKFNDGSPIQYLAIPRDWTSDTKGAYCWYGNNANEFVWNNKMNYQNDYGALYNWYAVSTGKLCPVGWHVPTDDDWHQLILFLDPAATNDPNMNESKIAGGKLKESGTKHWHEPNTGATDEFGFRALPGGFRIMVLGLFYDAHDQGSWWSSTENDSNTAWERFINFDSSKIRRGYDRKDNGDSVRCIKD